MVTCFITLYSAQFVFFLDLLLPFHSYARRNSPTYQPYLRRSRSHSSSRSRSTTPEDTGRVTFITSFGEDDQASRESTAAALATSSVKSSEPQSWSVCFYISTKPSAPVPYVDKTLVQVSLVMNILTCACSRGMILR